MTPIHVLLADDHDLVRAGIRSLLESTADIVVVAEAAEGFEALRLIQDHHPQVALVDLMMPALNGLEVLERVTRDFPSVRIIILSMEGGRALVLSALRAGAAGYLLKNSSPAELETAIRVVARGQTYLHPAVSSHLISDLRDHAEGRGEAIDLLTSRQREILRLVAEGNPTKVIAHKLDLSPKTVEMHRSQLMGRLNIHDVAGLVRYAVRTGVVSAEA
jgi:DNA-binding NarL/FixJ family response regulator